MVFVLDKNKKPLYPCHPAKARKLLKQGRAVIHKKYPFTIRLRDTVSDEEDEQEYRLKIDYGSKTTGLAILQRNKVIWLAELHHKINIKDNLDARRGFRRRRRNANLRYRKPRFNNRRRKEGWLPPSLRSRVDNIRNWVNKLKQLIPLTHISYENVKFDIQLMRNPEISGVEYQQGQLQGYEVREYLLEKYDRKCVYCGKKNIPLEIEHIIPKSRGGTNRIDNLTISCHDCNQKKGNLTAEEFGYPNIQKQAKQTLKDAAAVNSTRWAVYNVLLQSELDVECGTGARTKMQRINLGLPKEHYYDAICVGESTPEKLYFKTNEVLEIKAIGRGSHCRTKTDAYGFPRLYMPRQKYFFGFMTGDMIKAIVTKGKKQGVYYGTVACRSTGSFNIKTSNGIMQGISYKYCKVVQRLDGYNYHIKKVV